MRECRRGFEALPNPPPAGEEATQRVVEGCPHPRTGHTPPPRQAPPATSPCRGGFWAGLVFTYSCGSYSDTCGAQCLGLCLSVTKIVTAYGFCVTLSEC